MCEALAVHVATNMQDEILRFVGLSKTFVTVSEGRETATFVIVAIFFAVISMST